MNTFNDLCLGVIFLAQERGDQVSDLFFLNDRLHPGVVQDEPQVVSDLRFFLNLVVLGKGLSHNGDQHVEQVDQQQERSKDEQEPEDWLLTSH